MIYDENALAHCNTDLVDFGGLKTSKSIQKSTSGFNREKKNNEKAKKINC